METFYLIDFENVHNEGMENISTLAQSDHFANSTLYIDFSNIQSIFLQGDIVWMQRTFFDGR